MVFMFSFAGVALDSAQGLAQTRLDCLGPRRDSSQPGQQSIPGTICPKAHPSGNGGDFMAALFVLSA